MEFSLEILSLLVIAAFVAGFVDAVAGGGGLIVVPVLVAIGIDPVSAIATNKVQGTVGTASATWSYWRAGRIDLLSIRPALAASILGAVLGAVALSFANPRWLLAGLPIVLVAVGLYFWIGPRAADQDASARMTAAGHAPIAGGIGFYDGFFGPGTGSFFTLSLVTLRGMGLTRATAHAKALNLATNLVSLCVFAFGGHVLWMVGGAMAIGQFLGGRLGSNAAMRFGPRLIRPLLVVVCMAMAAKLLSDPANPLRGMATGLLSGLH